MVDMVTNNNTTESLNPSAKYFLRDPLVQTCQKGEFQCFFSLPNYSSSRPSLLLKMKRMRVPRRQTVLVFSTLESAVQSLYSQKAM